MKIANSIIAFDLDDTLTNTHQHMRSLLKLKLNIDVNRPDEWIVADGFSEEEIERTITDSLRYLTKTRIILPKPHAPKVIYETYKLTNQKVKIITARSKALKDVTEQWCQTFFGNIFELHFIKNVDKPQFLKESNILFWADDRLDVVAQCHRFMKKVFLVDNPIKPRYANYAMPDSISVIYDLNQIIKTLYEYNDQLFNSTQRLTQSKTNR